MGEKDMARAMHEAVIDAIRNAERHGETSVAPHIWGDIKGKLAHDYPREFQHAIDVSIEYNNGVYSDEH